MAVTLTLIPRREPIPWFSKVPAESNPVEFDSAKQFVGFYVGSIMRRHGHSIVKKSVRVPGKLFTVGALWSPEPTSSTGEDGI